MVGGAPISRAGFTFSLTAQPGVFRCKRDKFWKQNETDQIHFDNCDLEHCCILEVSSLPELPVNRLSVVALRSRDPAPLTHFTRARHCRMKKTCGCSRTSTTGSGLCGHWAASTTWCCWT